MPLDEQLELIDAHPRLGAPPATVSALSHVEQGYDARTRRNGARGARPRRRRSRPRRVAAELDRLNAAYEARFGFRYCVFVAGRSRAALLPGLAAALEADRDAEIRARARRGDRHRPRPLCDPDRRSSGGTGVIELGANRYGKAAIRLVRVARGAAGDRVRDLTVAIALEGDFEAAHTDGDNSLVIATDTMKNTAYAFAKDHLDGSIEDYGRALAEHFLDDPQVDVATVNIRAHHWAAIDVGGSPAPRCVRPRRRGDAGRDRRGVASAARSSRPASRTSS